MDEERTVHEIAINKQGQLSTILRKGALLSEELWPDERLSTIRAMVLPEATQADLIGFLSLCNRYKLDPFLGEIWLAVSKGRIFTLTGRAAMIKAASADPGYQGFDSGVVYEKDEFTVERSGVEVIVHHVINGFDRGELAGAYCVAYHANKRPVLCVRPWEYYKHLQNKDNWVNYGEDMIETRCIVASLRRQYQISGLYEQGEFGDEGADMVGRVEKDLDALAGDLETLQLAQSAALQPAIEVPAELEDKSLLPVVTEGPVTEAEQAPAPVGDKVASSAKSSLPASMFPCEYCDASFKTQQALGGHKAGHRKRGEIPDPKDTEQESLEIADPTESPGEEGTTSNGSRETPDSPPSSSPPSTEEAGTPTQLTPEQAEIQAKQDDLQAEIDRKKRAGICEVCGERLVFHTKPCVEGEPSELGPAPEPPCPSCGGGKHPDDEYCSSCRAVKADLAKPVAEPESPESEWHQKYQAMLKAAIGKKCSKCEEMMAPGEYLILLPDGEVVHQTCPDPDDRPF